MKPRYVMDFEKPILELEERLEQLKRLPAAGRSDLALEILEFEGKIELLRRRLYQELGPWERVQVARHPDRPHTLDYVNAIFSRFQPLRGDRLFRDDPAIVAGIGYLDGQAVCVLGHQKGRDTKENLYRNFGYPHPEGYRKALRAMREAGEHGLAIVSFIDTPGAYPGVGAEERGQAWAIAENLLAMSALPAPIVAVVVGEGGSGGALGIGVCDRLYMLEYSYYSVIAPEGCASILWRDDSRAAEAAQALKLTAADLIELGICDGMIGEPEGGAHRDPGAAIEAVRDTVRGAIEELSRYGGPELVELRYQRLRAVGAYTE